MTIDLYLPKRKRFDKQQHKFQLTRKKLEQGSKKFWNQRYSLFSRFDEGVFMNQELWYSVTPESVAIFLAKFIQACDPDIKCVLDVFCGGGGNTIQFARKFDKCIGVDFNQENLYCTENNCYVYGVEESTELIFGDWTNIEEETMNYLQEEVDFVFASPPWGGTGYKNKDSFDLNYLLPFPIKKLLTSFFKISKNVCLFLPRNSNLLQLSQVTKELLGPDAVCRVIYTYNEGFIKGLLVFFGEKFMPENIDKQTLAEQNKMIMEQFKLEQEARNKKDIMDTTYEFEVANENFYDDPPEQDQVSSTFTITLPASSISITSESQSSNVSRSTTHEEQTSEQEKADGVFFFDGEANDETETINIIQETEAKRHQAWWDYKKDKKNKTRKRQNEGQDNKVRGKRGKRQRVHTFFEGNNEQEEKDSEVEEAKKQFNNNEELDY